MSWDTRSTNTLECLKTPSAEVESMAISGCNLMVAVGSSVNVYDLRSFNKSVYAKELFPGFQIRCVQAILNSEGITTNAIIYNVMVLAFLTPLVVILLCNGLMRLHCHLFCVYYCLIVTVSVVLTIIYTMQKIICNFQATVIAIESGPIHIQPPILYYLVFIILHFLRQRICSYRICGWIN